MVPAGITGTGGIQATGTISIDIMVMVIVGIMAIAAMMPGKIAGGMGGVMVKIWIVAAVAVKAIMVAVAVEAIMAV
jgi:hypothetical protein